MTTPTDIHTHLVVATDKDEIVDVPYKEVVRSLIYFMTLTRLNITYVNYVAKFVEWPTTAHWTTIKQIFRYLQGIVDFGLLYLERVTNNILMGYCDCDFASNPNDCKSRTGYVFTIAKAAIVWPTDIKVALLCQPQKLSMSQHV